MFTPLYNLTTVSPVYSDPSVDQRAASLLSLLVHSVTDVVLSGVRSLISELKPEQHNLHLSHHTYTTCKDAWSTDIRCNYRIKCVNYKCDL